MPQFIMEGILEPAFQDLDAFTQGYIQALFFTSHSCIPMADWHSEESQERINQGQADGDLPNDAGFPDLHPDTLDAIAVDCVTFQIENAKALQAAYDRGYTEEQAGMDFWYDRNGHGTGFWDRNLGDAGEDLSEAAKKCGEVCPWFSGEADESSPTGHGWVHYSY